MSESEFGKYRLIAELGHGGMADVLLAVVRGPMGLGFSKLLVVKRLRPHLTDEPEFVAMLIDEARIAARLNHPNVVQTVEVGEFEGQYFISMEFLDGQPLHRVLYRADKIGVPIPKALRYRIVADVLAGLHHAHELADYDGTSLEVVHRDVTPHNVFVTYDGQVKVVDFGVAKAAGRVAETRTGAVKGKLAYMAPEQALAKPLDRRADIFSCGVMLWEAAVGRRIWRGLQELEIMGRMLRGNIPASPRAVNPEVPEAIDEMCRKALRFEPDDRFATAQEFQNELEAYLEADVVEAGPRRSTAAAVHTNRELGKLVADLFDDRRKQLRDIIERQLSTLKAEPAFTMATLTAASGASPRRAALLSSPAERAFTSSDDSPPADDEVQTAVVAHDKPSRRPSNELRVALLIAGFTAAAGLVWAASAARSSTPVGEPSPAGPAESPATDEPSPPQPLMLTLRASPASARFILDDGPVLQNPFIGPFPRDGREHMLRIEADGYIAKTRPIVFDNDAVVDVSLERIWRKPSGIGAGSPPVSRPPSSAGKKPPRKLDADNPFK